MVWLGAVVSVDNSLEISRVNSIVKPGEGERGRGGEGERERERERGKGRGEGEGEGKRGKREGKWRAFARLSFPLLTSMF